jgi:hypothetical protein
VCRSKHVEPSVNLGIINSITKLHLVVVSTISSTRHGSMDIKFINAKQAIDIHAYKNTKRKPHILELLIMSGVPLETC